MGNSIKELNWVQKVAIKALGLTNMQANVNKFQNTIISQIGINALWLTDNQHTNAQAYTNNSTVYSIINRITKMAAIPEFKVYRVKKDKKSLHRKYQQWTGEHATVESLRKAMQLKSFVYEEDNDHELNALIENPNKWQKGNEFVVNSIGFKLLTGNRFLYLNKLDAGADMGKPFEIYNLPPQFMQILPDGTPYGVQGYVFDLGDKERLPLDAIIHSKYFNPDFDITGGHLWGMSPLRAGRKNLTRSDAALQRGTATLQNAGAAGMLYDKQGGTPDETSIEQAAQIKQAVNDRINGSDNSGSISMASGDFGYINFGMSALDMQVIEAEKYSDIKLCNIYSFPPEVLNPDNSTFNNSKEFDKHIITGAVIPELNSLRDDWNEIAKLWKGEDIYVDFDLSAYPALQEDLDKVATRLEKIWYMKPNEKRLALGMDEDSDVENMNTYWIPSGLTPIDQLGEPDLSGGLDDMEAET